MFARPQCSASVRFELACRRLRAQTARPSLARRRGPARVQKSWDRGSGVVVGRLRRAQGPPRRAAEPRSRSAAELAAAGPEFTISMKTNPNCASWCTAPALWRASGTTTSWSITESTARSAWRRSRRVGVLAECAGRRIHRRRAAGAPRRRRGFRRRRSRRCQIGNSAQYAECGGARRRRVSRHQLNSVAAAGAPDSGAAPRVADRHDRRRGT